MEVDVGAAYGHFAFGEVEVVLEAFEDVVWHCGVVVESGGCSCFAEDEVVAYFFGYVDAE